MSRGGALRRPPPSSGGPRPAARGPTPGSESRVRCAGPSFASDERAPARRLRSAPECALPSWWRPPPVRWLALCGGRARCSARRGTSLPLRPSGRQAPSQTRLGDLRLLAGGGQVADAAQTSRRPPATWQWRTMSPTAPPARTHQDRLSHRGRIGREGLRFFCVYSRSGGRSLNFQIFWGFEELRALRGTPRAPARHGAVRIWFSEGAARHSAASSKGAGRGGAAISRSCDEAASRPTPATASRRRARCVGR